MELKESATRQVQEMEYEKSRMQDTIRNLQSENAALTESRQRAMAAEDTVRQQHHQIHNLQYDVDEAHVTINKLRADKEALQRDMQQYQANDSMLTAQAASDRVRLCTVFQCHSPSINYLDKLFIVTAMCNPCPPPRLDFAISSSMYRQCTIINAYDTSSSFE